MPEKSPKQVSCHTSQGDNARLLSSGTRRRACVPGSLLGPQTLKRREDLRASPSGGAMQHGLVPACFARPPVGSPHPPSPETVRVSDPSQHRHPPACSRLGSPPRGHSPRGTPVPIMIPTWLSCSGMLARTSLV